MSKHKSKEIDEIKEKARPVLKKYGVTEASVFGSYVHGSPDQDSDIDIAVKIESNLSLLDFVGLKQELEEVLERSVDVVEYAEMKPRISKHIQENKVPIT